MSLLFFFFFNDTATTEIYTLSLHDALPISRNLECDCARTSTSFISRFCPDVHPGFFLQRHLFQLRARPDAILQRARAKRRSEEHTSELQSQSNLVCRLLLEKKKKLSTTSDISGSVCILITSSIMWDTSMITLPFVEHRRFVIDDSGYPGLR